MISPDLKPNLPSQNALEQVVALSQYVAPDAYTPQIQIFRDDIRSLRAAIKNPLRIEQGAVRVTEVEIDALQYKLETAQQLSKAVEQGYRLMSTEPLTWRRPQDGWPTFGIFSTDEETPVFEISLSRHGEFNVGTNNTPSSIDPLYEDVRKSLTKELGYHDFVAASCALSDLIPPEVRVTIRKAQKIFGNGDVFIVAEADKWNIRTYEHNPYGNTKRDPIVMGHEWRSETFWLVTKYNATYIEDLAASWKSGRPTPPSV